MRPRAEENLETLSNLSGKCKKSLRLMNSVVEISAEYLIYHIFKK